MTTESNDEQNKVVKLHLQTLLYRPTKFGCSSFNRFFDLKETRFFCSSRDRKRKTGNIFFFKWQKIWEISLDFIFPENFTQFYAVISEIFCMTKIWEKNRNSYPNIVPHWAPRTGATEIKLNRPPFQAIVHISWNF